MLRASEVGLVLPGPGQRHEGRLRVAADEPAIERPGGDARLARARERIEDEITGVRIQLDQPVR